MSANDGIIKCVQETAERLNISRAAVLKALGDHPGIQKAYSLRGMGMTRKDFFMTPALRQIFADAVEAQLVEVVDDSQCIDKDIADAGHSLAELIRLPRKLGQGSFGTVYSGCAPPLNKDRKAGCKDGTVDFAVKVAVSGKAGIRSDKKNWHRISGWHETYTTEVIQRAVLDGGLGQAVPRLYRHFACLDNCSYVKEFPYEPGRKGEPKTNGSCAITLTELGDGTLKDWAKTELAKQPGAYENALFQMMAGLAALQSPGLQVFHNDIKDINTLYYRVQPGGHWRYTIGGETFYIPNLGFVMIIADYGVSMPYSPAVKFVAEKRDVMGVRGLVRSAKDGLSYLIGLENGVVGAITPNGMSQHNFFGKEIPAGFGKELGYKKYDRAYNYTDYKGKQKLMFGGLNYTNPGKIKREKFANTTVWFPLHQAEDILHENGFADASKAVLSIDLLMRPDIYPPIMFGTDVQDVIRTFVGGKRNGQPGDHSNVLAKRGDASFVRELKEYVVEKGDTNDHAFSFYNHKMFAQDFIHHFFAKRFRKVDNSFAKQLASFECSL